MPCYNSILAAVKTKIIYNVCVCVCVCVCIINVSTCLCKELLHTSLAVAKKNLVSFFCFAMLADVY